MDKRIVAGLLMIPLTLNMSCATAPKSMLLGGLIGGAAGAGVGQGISQDSTGTAVGALVGVGVGSLLGYLSYSDKQKKSSTPEQRSPPVNEDLAPSLTRPKVRSYIVPDTIEGNKYIKSHRVFILEDPGSWSKE